jgi:hypothetical protein
MQSLSKIYTNVAPCLNVFAVSVDVIEDWISYVVNILKTIQGKWRRMNSKFSTQLTYLCIRVRWGYLELNASTEPMQECSSVKRLLNSNLTEHTLWLFQKTVIINLDIISQMLIVIFKVWRYTINRTTWFSHTHM